MASAALLFGAALYAGFVVSGSAGELVGIMLAVAGTLFLFLALLLVTVARCLVLVAPSQIAILSGRRHRAEDGSTVGFRIVRGGRALRIPLLERVDFVDLTNRAVSIRLSDCHAKKGARVSIEAIANAKIAGDMPLVSRAVERFLGSAPDDVTKVIREVVEGGLRGVVAGATVEELREQPLEVANRVIAEVEEEMHQMGLLLDSLKIGAVETH